MAERYHNQFTWDGPYGRMVGLLRRLGPADGLILDLGCGFGALAEPLSELGYTYVGIDLAADGMQDLATRGFETHNFDLRMTADLAEWLIKVAADRAVAAILMMDALEHLADVTDTLEGVRQAALVLGHPLLGLSVPHAGHFDVGVKLAMGRWDMRPSGLLDETHLRFFTEAALADLTARSGWIEVGRDDFRLHHSDQYFPPDHPALAEATPLHQYLWQLRGRIDNTGTINQFIRIYSPIGRPKAQRPGPTDDPAPFLSVLVRTQGQRMENLAEALTCLAAQDDDLEVRLLVHTNSTELIGAVRALVATFAPQFASRVHVHPVSEGGRGHPLNVGLDQSRGRYVAFLDDDDLVTADWAGRFKAGAGVAPGKVIRSITADRSVRRNGEGDQTLAYVTLSGLEMNHTDRFDPFEHLYHNRTPICSFAVPTEAVRALGIRFDENLAVLEDWAFLIAASTTCGVHDTNHVTSVYHRWQDEESSLGSVDTAVWETTRASILQRLDQAPMLVPPGSASRLATMWNAWNLARAEDGLIGRLAADLAERDAAVDEYRQQLDEIRGSTFWRATLPARRTVTVLRSVRSLGSRRSLPSLGSLRSLSARRYRRGH